MIKFSAATLAGLALLSLAGCTAHPMGSDLLADALASGRTDDRAQERCTSTMPGPYPLMATVDSTVADVRDLAGEVDTPSGWDDHMLRDADTFLAICIYDVRDADVGLPGDPDYIAYWSGEDGTSDGASIIHHVVAAGLRSSRRTTSASSALNVADR